MSGKGSVPRPFSVDRQTFEDNWNQIFGSKKSNENVWANRNVWNEPELAKQDRLADEIASIKNMKDKRSEAEKQEAAWLKDEYYDVDVDRDDTIV
jgi:hypothetical protein